MFMNMMERASMKNGFTLIELLAVIVILGIVAVITVAVTTGILGDSRESLEDSQKEIILSAAENWAIANGDVLPFDSSDEPYELSLEELASDGYIDSSDITNPSDNTKICGYVEISYNDSTNQYNYELVEENC